MKNKIILCLFFLLFVSPGCVGLQYDYETPSVSITSFKTLPSDGIVPRFEITLLVINPNRTALNLEGISYSLEIEGYKILTGVSNNLPRIEGYGQGEVVLLAAPNLLRSVQLITDLINSKKEALHYAVDAKLDIGSMRPRIKTREEGTFSFVGNK